jgi:hypothetical protein
MPDEKWRYKGGAADEGCVAKGLADPLDELLVDWRSLDALGREQARLQWLWRNGLLTARALRAGIWALDRMAQTRALAMGDRMVEIEAALSRVQAQVAMATPQQPQPLVRPRLLS